MTLKLIGSLRSQLSVWAKKIQSKVYENGFFKRIRKLSKKTKLENQLWLN